MTTRSRIVRFALVSAFAVSSWMGCSTPSAGRRADAPADSLSVRELTIVDAKGQPRIRIGAPLPAPKGAERRQVEAVGIQFMDPNGYEIGGLAMLDSIGIRGLCFDSEQGYEAMCIGLIQGEPNITFRHDWKERITLGVENGVASIVLHDAQGNPHLRLEVDKDGKTHVVGVTPTPPGK